MSSKEDYLDNLLQTVSAGDPSDGTALKKLADIKEEKTTSDTDIVGGAQGFDVDSMFDDIELEEDELEFPELEMLFGETPEQTEEEAEIDLPEDGVEDISLSDGTELIDEMLSLQGESDELSAPEVADVFGELFSDGEEVAESLKEITDMDISELEAMMAGGSLENLFGQEGVQESEVASTDTDVTDLIDAMDEDSDLAEISELLRMSDNNEMIPEEAGLGIGNNSGTDVTSTDVEALLAGMEMAGLSGDSEVTDDAGSVPVFAEGTVRESKKAKRERKKQEKKEKREKKAAERKPGWLKRLFAFLMEDDDYSDIDAEIAQLDLSQENIAILEEIDNENAKGIKKLKKEKKPKVKKEKKPKKEKVPKPKKEKKPKVKKEKKPKEPAEPEKPLKPFGRRRIMTGVFFGLTVFGMIMLFTVFIPGFVERREGRQAYQDGDYKKVYELFGTKEVKGTEEKMLKGAMLCLQMERKLESYENYKKLEGMEIEQLHALIGGVGKYQKIQGEAQQYGVEVPVKNSYLNILGILQSEYGVSEEDAKNLAIMTDEVAYTKELMQILGIAIPTAEEEKRR